MWISSIALAGGLLATGPILIHILFRRRYRTLDFAAMRFLLESLRRTKQRMRLEELILIALRVLLCLLVGLTLADIRAESLLPGRAAPTAHVFVLDDSFSFGQQAGEETLFSKAAAGVADIISSLPDNDMVAIVSACQPGTGDPLGHLVLAGELKREDFLRRLTSLRPGDLRADFPRALSAVVELLASQQDMLGRVYVVSDFREIDFVGPQQLESLGKAFKAVVQAPAELTLLDYGLPCADNLTVERVELGQNLVVTGVPAQVRVVVRNNGRQTAKDPRVTVEIGSVKLPTASLPPLPVGQTASANFDYLFPEAGPAGVKVSTTPDSLAADNTGWLALNVREALRALIVDGSDDPARADSASFCLRHALDPSGTGEYHQRVDVVAPKAIPKDDLGRYDVVFLANVGDFGPAVSADGKTVRPNLEALRAYVRDGGGLGIFVGDAATADVYNGLMYEDGAGLSPLPLQPAPPPKPDPETYVRIRPDSIAADSMLKIFTLDDGKLSGLVRFYVHLAARKPQDVTFSRDVGPPQVLASFNDADQSPAVAKRSYGKGTVIMWYTSADTRWTDWPKNFSFLPVVNDMAWQLARASREDFHGQVGQEIYYPVPAALADATSIMLKTPAYPAEDLQALQLRGEEGRKVAAFPDVRQAGLYRMEFVLADRTRRTVLFSRHVDPAEGDLAKARADQVADAVGQEHTYRGELALGGKALEPDKPRRAYWWIFLVLALLVLAAESFLGQRFGHYATQMDSARDRSA